MSAGAAAVRFLFVSVLASGSLAQSASPHDAGPEPDGLDPWSVFETSHGLATVEGELVGVGSGYRARFASEGVRFLPALGERAPQDLPLDMVLRTIRRGELVLHEAATDVEPGRAGNLVWFPRGGSITERYEVLAEGVYQSFVFDEPLQGSGDLIVRLELATALDPLALDDGSVLFESPGLGGVHFGAVQGIDAAGNSVSGELRFDGSFLELVLPDAFVSNATYPLVLDPLIGAQQSISVGASEDRDPEIGYGGGQYLVVWERVFSFDHIDLLGQRLNGAGTPIGPTIFIALSPNNIFQFNPSIGFANATDRFLVAWAYQEFAAFQEDVYCATVDLLGNVSAAIELGDSLDTKRAPKVGGNRNSTNDECLVIWDEFSVGIRGQTVRALAGGPVPFGATETLVADNLLQNVMDPCLSKSADLNEPYLMALTSMDPFSLAFDYDRIQGCTVAIGGTLGANALFSDTTLAHDAAAPSCDGDGDHFIVAWEVDETKPATNVHDIRGRHVKVVGTSLVPGPVLDIENGGSDNEIDVNVAYAKDSTVVLYRDFLASAGRYDLYAKSIDPFNGNVCRDEALINLSGNEAGSAGVVARHSSGASTDDAFFVWHESNAGVGDVVGVRWSSPGNSKDLGGDCGRGGESFNPCPIAGNNSFTLHLQGSTPNAMVVLVTAGAEFRIACGPCELIPNLESVFFQATDACGDASQTISLCLSMAGVTFYSQWATFLSPGSGACPLAPLDFSNALRTTID